MEAALQRQRTGLLRQLREVVCLAEVAEDELPCAPLRQGDCSAASVDIGGGPAAPEYALLERLGMGAGAQHVRVVVGLEHHGV